MVFSSLVVRGLRGCSQGWIDRTLLQRERSIESVDGWSSGRGRVLGYSRGGDRSLDCRGACSVSKVVSLG